MSKPRIDVTNMTPVNLSRYLMRDGGSGLEYELGNIIRNLSDDLYSALQQLRDYSSNEWVMGSKEYMIIDKLVELGYIEPDPIVEFVVTWDKRIYGDAPSQIVGVDHFSSDNGYSREQREAVLSLVVGGSAGLNGITHNEVIVRRLK